MAPGASSNGAIHKVPGRVGDAAVPGGGAYADSAVGGCGATGGVSASFVGGARAGCARWECMPVGLHACWCQQQVSVPCRGAHATARLHHWGGGGGGGGGGAPRPARLPPTPPPPPPLPPPPPPPINPTITRFPCPLRFRLQATATRTSLSCPATKSLSRCVGGCPRSRCGRRVAGAPFQLALR